MSNDWLVDNTPLEQYELGGSTIWVKREDLCCPPPGPSFSKVRGAVSHIQAQPASVIGVLDTFHSKAGWAVAYVCSKLGKRCVNFWPRYKRDPEGIPREQQRVSQGFGASLVSLPAGRSAVLFHRAKKFMNNFHPGGYMMPNALKLPESITENAAEVERTELPDSGTMILSISSGTIAAGVIQGLSNLGILPEYDIVLHMGYSRSKDAVRSYIKAMSNVDINWDNVWLVDEGYDYKSGIENFEAPFPCNAHYDLKAWVWLTEHFVGLTKPIVFWNVGD